MKGRRRNSLVFPQQKTTPSVKSDAELSEKIVIHKMLSIEMYFNLIHDSQLELQHVTQGYL